ncbi:MAG: tRNA uridine-5-carboxymethylaminomethyl(34) synthesis GTPase MnmE [Opitutaceae bacterium]
MDRVLSASDTIAALGTPAGTAALAVVRITGGDARALVGDIFGREPAPRRAVLAAYRDRSGVLIDEVLVTVFAGPRSYTGEDMAEISAHGSPYLAQRILEDLHARGCRPADPGEFTRRAFLNGRLDLSQAEAVMDLIHARSEQALAAAHRQLRGSLRREMDGLCADLIGTLARVEAYIDFPDEDLPAENRTELRGTVARIMGGAARLLATRHYGELLREGAAVVIVGEPNAGKSSLLNRLVGRDRAIVSPEPGTTRDFLEERVRLGPHLARLVDTAGLNPDPGPVERLGIGRAWECIHDADILLAVLDAARPLPGFWPEFDARRGGRPTLVAWNKTDLHPEAAAPAPDGLPAWRVSALTGAGVEELRVALEAAVSRLQPLGDGEAVAINARHAQALVQARECLESALRKLASSSDPALLASDLRGALDAFGEIAGRIDHERVLDALFAKFCIGK